MNYNQIQKERSIILSEFKKMGFWGKTAFFNVCKSLDVTLNGFELLQFYEGISVKQSLINRLYAIIECVKNE